MVAVLHSGNVFALLPWSDNNAPTAHLSWEILRRLSAVQLMGEWEEYSGSHSHIALYLLLLLHPYPTTFTPQSVKLFFHPGWLALFNLKTSSVTL